MARLELDSVTKRFGEGDGSVLAVDDVDIDVADGEFLVLVGPSGCGKSTTLRMVAGLESITDGEIRLDGERMNEQGPAERDIAMVFQSYALYPHMTVRQNMRFGLEESTDLDEAEMDRRVDETAALLDITELLDRKPGALSGGQRQRVALGRAIVREPKAFLMDEPLSNLDAKLRSQMRTELQQLQADLDTTTVYVTHDQTEAMTMGDRIAILDAGELQQVATPLEAYHRPANRFVAGFIGEPSMNFIECDIDGDALVRESFHYPLSAEAADAVAGAANVTLGIRPEDVSVSVDSRGNSDGDDADTDSHSFAATVDVVEPMGDENVVHLSLADGPKLVATVDGLRRIEDGADVVVVIPENAIHVFDADTGDALHSRSLDDAELNDERV
ncbi:ABC transporter ATP-binding protein [Halorubrum trueperi]|uniref:ABC-type D-xylose/L-arabinose transporter n=1 Tax=Halorubrum trueperi TaxID=2004704 RepID=A0ABD5UKV6_9EURY